MLDHSDINRVLPYYFFDYRMSLRAKEKASEDEGTEKTEDNIVIRNGKKYRKTTADKAEWANSIF